MTYDIGYISVSHFTFNICLLQCNELIVWGTIVGYTYQCQIFFGMAYEVKIQIQTYEIYISSLFSYTFQLTNNHFISHFLNILAGKISYNPE